MKKILIFSVLVLTALGLPSRTPNFRHGDPKVTNGRDASYGEFPYQVSLQDGSFGYDFPICGGSIYNQYFIITAGHCIYEEDIDDPSYLKIYAGDYALSDSDGNEQIITLAQIILHESFNSFTLSNDIALLKLSSPLDLTGPYAKPIALPLPGHTFTGDCTLTGWGLTTAGGQNAEILQAVDLSIVSDAECRAIYGTSEVEDTMLCAGGDNQGGCSGDSGGPFACMDGGQSYLAGIASWANGCGLTGFPGVLTEVSYFSSWIEQHAV